MNGTSAALLLTLRRFFLRMISSFDEEARSPTDPEGLRRDVTEQLAKFTAASDNLAHLLLDVETQIARVGITGMRSRLRELHRVRDGLQANARLVADRIKHLRLTIALLEQNRT